MGLRCKFSPAQPLLADDPTGIILGEGLARNLGAGVGDRIVLLASTSDRGINAVEVIVGGVFSTANKSYDDSTLRMDIEKARQLMRVKGSHVWMLLLKDTARTDKVLERLRSTLPKKDFEVIPWYVLADFYNKTVILFGKQIQGVKIILALVILLSISNTMMMSVMERIGEIGTSMALGVKRISIMQLFVSEAVVLGCVGGLLGLFLGLLLAYIISSIGIPMPAPPGMTKGYTGQIMFTWDIALESLALAISTTLAASSYPAWRASQLQIVDALRHNR